MAFVVTLKSVSEPWNGLGTLAPTLAAPAPAIKNVAIEVDVFIPNLLHPYNREKCIRARSRGPAFGRTYYKDRAVDPMGETPAGKDDNSKEIPLASYCRLF